MCGCNKKKRKQKCKCQKQSHPICTTPKCFNLFKNKKKTIWPKKRRRKMAGLKLKSKNGKVHAKEKNSTVFDFLK